ncbi:MAG: thioesterase [Clostridia bacterium]|nr:thioesterase [Clostridia bacterium]
MRKVWEESFSVKISEVDFKNRIKTGSLFSYMQEAAANHANNLELGYIQSFNNSELIWVLSRAKVKVYGIAGWKDELRVKTWPKGTDGLFAVRDFLIFKGNGELVCSATTSWLVLDKDTMRPKKMSDVIPEGIPINQQEHGIDEKLDKLKIECDLPEQSHITAAYSDIDVNRHVNNAKYIDWIMDSFFGDLSMQGQLDSLRIDLLSETKLGDKITIGKGIYPENHGVYFFQGMNHTTQKKAFTARLEWVFE